MIPQYIEQKISDLEKDIRLFRDSGLVWLADISSKELRTYQSLREKYNGEHRSVPNGATQTV